MRIQLCGNVLNSSGVYNRCRLTRLVVDKEWDARVWEESWQGKEIEKELVERLTRSGLLGDEEEARGIKRKTTTQD